MNDFNRSIKTRKFSRFNLLVAFSGLLILITSVGCISGATGRTNGLSLNEKPARYTTPLPPFKPIALAWFYHAPPEGVDASLLAQYFSLFISSQEMEEGRDQLRALGSTATFLQYVVLNEVIEADTCQEKPYDNQAANQPGDYCTIDQLHPDWFLMTSNGQRVRDKPPYDKSLFMDPSNADWRQFWITRVLARDTGGWDGIFIDNLEARPRYHENELLNFPTLDDYQKANQEFMRSIYQEFKTKDLRVYANILHATTEEEWQLYLPYLDGAMIENFAVDWESGDYLTVEQWELQMRNALSAQSMGKEVILVAQGDANDTGRQELALASYLLVNNGKAYFRYTGKRYDELLWYMNYLDEPGAPLGDMFFQDGQWKREFENGRVSVNPNDHTAVIEFGS